MLQGAQKDVIGLNPSVLERAHKQILQLFLNGFRGYLVLDLRSELPTLGIECKIWA